MSQSHALSILLYQQSQQQSVDLSTVEFDEWCKTYSFGGLDGSTLGQAFCRDFAIQDFLLTHSLTTSRAINYIKDTYVNS
jgi:hypothetical protein